MEYIYLLCTTHNCNHKATWDYFKSDTKLAQEDIDRFILSVCPSAGRGGSNFLHVQKGAQKEGINIEIIEGTMDRIALRNKLQGSFNVIEGNY